MIHLPLTALHFIHQQSMGILTASAAFQVPKMEIQSLGIKIMEIGGRKYQENGDWEP